jgi:hypothetical protein
MSSGTHAGIGVSRIAGIETIVGVTVSVAVQVGVLVLVIVRMGRVVWVASTVLVDVPVDSPPPPAGPQEQRQMPKLRNRKNRITRIA